MKTDKEIEAAALEKAAKIAENFNKFATSQAIADRIRREIDNTNCSCTNYCVRSGGDAGNGAYWFCPYVPKPCVGHDTTCKALVDKSIPMRWQVER